MAYREYSFADIEKAIAAQNKKYNLEQIKKAYDFGEKAHEGQMRKSGERYFNHPTAVSIIIIDLGLDTESGKEKQ